jgi:hypothetical protein
LFSSEMMLSWNPAPLPPPSLPLQELGTRSAAEERTRRET